MACKCPKCGRLITVAQPQGTVEANRSSVSSARIAELTTITNAPWWKFWITTAQRCRAVEELRTTRNDKGVLLCLAQEWGDMPNDFLVNLSDKLQGDKNARSSS